VRADRPPPRRRGLLRLGLVIALGLVLVGPPAGAAAVGDEKDFDAAFATSPAVAERQAQLVQGEDERLIDVRVAGAARQVTYPLRPYRVRSSGLYTLVLPARRAAYTLADLRVLAPETFLPQRDGTILLREHILVDAGATLALAPSKPTTIRMLSGADGFVSIVARGGKLRLLGSAAAPLSFVSWDETRTGADSDVTDGRAYILAMGQLVVKHANFTNLGFWSGRTGGLALAGSGDPSAGLDLGSGELTSESGSSTDGRQAEVLPSGALPGAQDAIDTVVGQVTDTTITGDAFGFFVTGASGIKMRNVTISGSLVSGLILHRNVTSAQIEQVLVQRSGADGIVVTRGVEGALLTQVTSTGNGRDGVVITGTPLATGPSPSGSSTRQFGNNVLTASLVENNARTGVRIVGGTKVRLLGNSLSGGIQGLLISTGATQTTIDANRISDVDGSGIQVRDADRIELSGNSVRSARTGVHVTNAQVTIAENTISGATLHAVTLVGDVTGTQVSANVLAGHGSSAIDMARLEGRSEPVLENNDSSGWDRTITKDGVLSTLQHPLTVVWICVALLIVVGRIMRRHRQDAVRIPYADGPANSISTSAIEADQRAAIHRAQVAVRSVTTAPAGIQIDLRPTPAGGGRRAAQATHDGGPGGRGTRAGGLPERLPQEVSASTWRPDGAPLGGSGVEAHRAPTADENAAWLREVVSHDRPRD
jgi:hypothetical protein